MGFGGHVQEGGRGGSEIGGMIGRNNFGEGVSVKEKKRPGERREEEERKEREVGWVIGQSEDRMPREEARNTNDDGEQTLRGRFFIQITRNFCNYRNGVGLSVFGRRSGWSVGP